MAQKKPYRSPSSRANYQSVFQCCSFVEYSRPIIGIKVNIIQIGDKKALHFTKVIDSYEEPEESEPTQSTYDEKYWVDNFPGAFECAKWYRKLLEKYYGEIPIKYFDGYVSLTVGGIARAWVSKRKNDRVFIEVKYVEEDLNEAMNILTRRVCHFAKE